MKLFPAALLGGPAMVNVLSGPFAHTGLKFVLSGGVTPATLADYLACPTVAAVGGTWLAKKEDLAAGDLAKITANCREAVKAVKAARA